MYTYVVQNPWTAFDPEGLETKKELEVIREKVTAGRDKAIDSVNSSDMSRGDKRRAVKDLEKKYDDVLNGINDRISKLENTARDIAEVTGGNPDDYLDILDDSADKHGPALEMYNQLGSEGFKEVFKNLLQGDLEGLAVQGGKELIVRRTLGVFGKMLPGKGKQNIWSSTKNKSSVENAYGHYKKHGSQFPEYKNAKQYAEGANNFVKNPPAGTLTKRRANGETVYYNPQTNTFAVQGTDGAPKTMFKPDAGQEYFSRQ